MVAVVTGGSRGIGKAIAEELMKKKYTVIVTARSKSSETDELEKLYSDRFLFLPCDISDSESRKNLTCFIDMMPYHATGIEKSDVIGKVPQKRFETPSVATLHQLSKKIELSSGKHCFFEKH